MRILNIQLEEFDLLLGTYPWNVVYYKNIPVTSLSEPNGYLFTTCSGTKLTLDSDKQNIYGGLAIYRADRGIIKRYEHWVHYDENGLYLENTTRKLRRNEHHVKCIADIPTDIFNAIPSEEKDKLHKLLTVH